MSKLALAVSVAVLTLSTPVFAQSNLGTDSSGRFDGSPPLGTGPRDDSGAFSIPIDNGTTASTTSDQIVIVQPERCRDIRRGAVRGTSAERDVCLNRR